MNENLLNDQERQVKITFAKSGLLAHKICLGPTNQSKDDTIKKILETGCVWVDALSDHLLMYRSN